MTTRFQPGDPQTAAGLEARLASTLLFDEPVTRVKLVSPARAKVLARLHIETVRDLLTHFPRRYVDMSAVSTVADARIGQACTICGQVYKIEVKRPKRVPLVEITLVDGTGTLMLTMFRQVWLADKVRPGMTVAVAGKLEFDYGFKRMTNPYLEVLEQGADAAGVVIPVHPATEKISAAMMRRLISNALDATRGVLDPLPLSLRVKYRLMSKQSALFCIHFPQNMAEQAEARRRLVYEELLLLQITLMVNSDARSTGKAACTHVVDGPCMQALEAAVPFELTDEQRTARAEILAQLAAPKAANHMLLGDVGTGKTVVAAFALAAAADTGAQAALMAPTELLARQHAESLGPLLDAAGITWDVLTGSTDAARRASILARVASGQVSVLIGTHALIEPDVVFENLTLAVIDEQQRFGVDQRAALLGKGDNPDSLLLTATPIPRTLALALFGNLTLSYLHKRPNDCVKRTTKVHPRTLKGEAYDAALEALARGEQVYVVCPLIGAERPYVAAENLSGERLDSGKSSKGRDSAQGFKTAAERFSAENRDSSQNLKTSGERLDSGKSSKARGSRASAPDEDAYEYANVSIEAESDMQGENVAAAKAHARFLQEKTFIDYKVELLHGKLPAAEKQAVMQRFAAGETQVLVATTVIEVGINVPNATVMIIEDADRFGLAQLHQLRGRVGRGNLPAQVHLISGSKAPTALTRLAAMEKTDDGFELSNYDLSLRREGDILGNRQSGASGLKLVNIVRDGAIIEAAHNDARAMLDADPGLREPEHRALAREARMVFGATIKGD